MHKAITVLLSFSSKLRLHLCYNKNGVNGSFTFHKTTPLLLLLLQPFYSPLDCVQDYPGEPGPERKNQAGFTGARDSEWKWHQMSICNSASRRRLTARSAYHHSVFKPNCISSISICCQILSTTFIAFSKFNTSVRSTLHWIPFPFVNQ